MLIQIMAADADGITYSARVSHYVADRWLAVIIGGVAFVFAYLLPTVLRIRAGRLRDRDNEPLSLWTPLRWRQHRDANHPLSILSLVRG